MQMMQFISQWKNVSRDFYSCKRSKVGERMSFEADLQKARISYSGKSAGQ